MWWDPDIRHFTGGTIEVPAGTGLVVGSVVAYDISEAEWDTFSSRFRPPTHLLPVQDWRWGASSAVFVIAGDGSTSSFAGRFWYHRDDPDLYAPIPEVGQHLEGWAANVPINAPIYRLVVNPTGIDFGEGAGVIWWPDKTGGFEVPDLNPPATDLAYAPPIEAIAPPTYERAVILAAHGFAVLSPPDQNLQTNLVLCDADPVPIEPVGPGTGGVFQIDHIGFPGPPSSST